MQGPRRANPISDGATSPLHLVGATQRSEEPRSAPLKVDHHMQKHPPAAGAGFQASCPKCSFPASAESLPTAPSGP